jgi:predicted alpha/beta superfamily hydrolase
MAQARPRRASRPGCVSNKVLNPTVAGSLRLDRALGSRLAEGGRDVIVYLPPYYERALDRRYPVLYLHDGQNLFDPKTAFAGNEWGLRKVTEELIHNCDIQPLIIVGIYNAGTNRVAEYTYIKDRRGRGGRAKLYAKLILEDVKPFIDREYRTLPDARNTGLGGSSLGGLVTLYLGLRFPQTFGKLIVMSPSVWWANRAILREVHRLRRKSDQKIWLDIGTREGPNPESSIKNTEELRDALVSKGWKLGYDLQFVEDEGAGHDEKAWGYRMRSALKFLFPVPANESTPFS